LSEQCDLVTLCDPSLCNIYMVLPLLLRKYDEQRARTAGHPASSPSL
jgi:hypothetical protein